MSNNIKKQRVIFENDIDPTEIVSNILKKYNLEETLEESCEKIIDEKELKVVTVVKGLKELFLNEISEKEFLSLLEK